MRREVVPVTPARKITSGQGPSTVKSSKKIRISVPTQMTDSAFINTNSKVNHNPNTNTITESTPKSKNIKITMTSATPTSKSAAAKLAIKEFSSIFPELKPANDFLNLTLEQFFDRLIKQKVGKFEEFLRQIEAENCEGNI
jgi:hypothetical protein